MNTEFQPADDNILVRLTPACEAGADNAAEWAEVVAVGQGRRLADGTLVAPDLVPGDRIAVRPHRAVHLRVQDQDFAIVAASDVLGILLHWNESWRRTTTSVLSGTPPFEPALYEALGVPPVESLETEVAPDLLDQEAPTADDLH